MKTLNVLFVVSLVGCAAPVPGKDGNSVHIFQTDSGVTLTDDEGNIVNLQNGTPGKDGAAGVAGKDGANGAAGVDGKTPHMMTLYDTNGVEIGVPSFDTNRIFLVAVDCMAQLDMTKVSGDIATPFESDLLYAAPNCQGIPILTIGQTSFPTGCYIDPDRAVWKASKPTTVKAFMANSKKHKLINPMTGEATGSVCDNMAPLAVNGAELSSTTMPSVQMPVNIGH